MNNISDVTNLKSACVRQKGQKYYFPKTIPRERESMTYTYLGVIVIVLLVHLYLTEDRSSFISLYAFTLMFYFVLIFIYRVILLIHEKQHCLSRYDDDNIKLLKAAFSFTIPSILVFIGCMLYIVYHLARFGWPTFQKDFWIVNVSLFYLHKILDLDSNPIIDSLSMAKGNALDYGSGMAYSFFYGYLNYILRKTGNQEKNLKEMMQDYEAVEQINFEVYKIFILIPKSMTCHVSVADVSRSMEMKKPLSDKIITVAGVRDRVYRNSVYSIVHEKTKKIVYVCTEYATPLQTFKEVVRNVSLHTKYYTRHKNDILLQFYLTLKQILEYEHMDNMCELVFYEDMDNHNKFHDVGRILLDRIVDFKKEQDASKTAKDK